jgi:hypothetical protein
MSDVTGLASRVSALEATMRQVQASINQQQTTIAQVQATPPAASLHLTLLSVPLTIVSNAGSGALAYSTYTSGQIPSTATYVLVTGFGRQAYNVGSRPGQTGAYVRSGTGANPVTIYSQNSDGTDSDTEGESFFALVPWSNGFQWSKDAGTFHFTLQIIGYFSVS